MSDPAVRYAWLIEREVPGDECPIQYLAMARGECYWISNADFALQFARKQDAEALRLLAGENSAKSVEHGW